MTSLGDVRRFVSGRLRRMVRRILSLTALLSAPHAISDEHAGKPETECRDFDVVRYYDPNATYLDRIHVDTDDSAIPSPGVLSELQAVISPHGTASLFVSRPDTMRLGPWSTQVFVVGNSARPISVSVTFSDHASYWVKVRWINEKLIWFEVWWGRIVSNQLILDVDSGTVEYAEQADYGIMILSCQEKRALATEQPIKAPQ